MSACPALRSIWCGVLWFCLTPHLIRAFVVFAAAAAAVTSRCRRGVLDPMLGVPDAVLRLIEVRRCTRKKTCFFGTLTFSGHM